MIPVTLILTLYQLRIKIQVIPLFLIKIWQVVLDGEIDRFLQSGQLPADSLIANYDPDYVLVHLGTNNLGSRKDTPQQTINKMGQLIDLIRSGDAQDPNKDTKIYIAQIIPLMDDAYGQGPGEYQLVRNFNALLPGLIILKKPKCRLS